MDTLRGFVRAVWSTDESVRNPYVPNQVWSKPDNVSQNYELRRLTTAEGKNGKRTDFFEFYWADLMEATEVKHLTSWLKLLLLRSPRRVPAQLRGLWGTIALLTVLVPGSLLLWYFGVVNISAKAISVISGVGAVLWFLASGLLLNIAGDAARYLHVSPPNIARRRLIRDAGIQLLQRLHDSKDYDRIILVGHSLGSIIGYDILTHLWPRFNTGHAEAIRGGTAKPDVLETLAAKSDLSAEEFQEAQATYASQLRQAGNKWLISDFVTLGSPLAHASFLMARQPEEFVGKKLERELPACPPVLESVKGDARFCYPSNKAWVPNHAAVFAPTRWTNLFFPCQWTIRGDVIGGPMQRAFGVGVKDVSVETSIRAGCLSHTEYWSFPKYWRPPAVAPEHIAALRRALRLS